MTLHVITLTRKQLSFKLQAVIWFWTSLSLLSIPYILKIPVVTALKPTAVYGAAYATINEDLFIIQGGGVYQNATFTANVSQFMALDLTRPSWDVSDPPWIPVNISSTEPLPQRLATYYHSMTISLDRQTVTIWDSASPGSVTNYTRYTGAWSAFDVPAELVRSEKQLRAAVDPNTGKIYIPLGYEGVNMLVYNPAYPDPGAATLDAQPRALKAAAAAGPDASSPAGAGTSIGVTMPPVVRRGATGYSFLWSSYRQTFLFFGGRVGLGDPNDPYFFEYQPNTNTWNTLSTKGVIPPRLISSCMISAYNGTKMILFGGHEMDAISKNTTYILDVPSLEWIKGPAVEVAQSRSAMACSVSGDNVVIWGGIRRTGTDPANYTALDATPLILNLYFKQWVPKFERGTHYTPLPVAPPSPISPPTPENTSAPEKSNVGDIVGSTLGGLLLSALVVASYIAHKKPQFLRQLIGWGNEPAEQPHLPGFFPPVLDLQGPINPSPANNNGNSSNSTNNDQHNPPVSPPQNLPENSGTSTSPSHLSTTSSPEVDAIVTWIQSESRQHLEAAIPTKTEFTFEPPSGSVPRSEPSAPVLTAASPSTESSSSKEECELQVFYPKAPSRASTLSCTTTLHTPDSPFTSTSTSRSPITSVNSLAPSQGSSSSSQASHQDSLLASTHPSLSSSNVTRPNNRNNSLSSEARPVRQANTWHSTPADSVLSSDESTPYVSQVPLPIGVLPPLSSMQSDPLPVKAELISFSSTSQPPKEPERSKSSSSSSSFAPPVPVKPGHLAFLYMNGMREASRQQNNGNVLSKSTLENSNQNTNLRSDSKNAFRATINKSTARQVLPAAASTNTASTIDHNYPPRGGETPTSTSIHRHRKGRDATASETYTATTIAHHPRENAVVAAAPRFGATLIVTPTRNTLTAIRRQPQGGHEPARSSSRNPQNVRGVGARKATFGDETPKLGVQSLSDKESGTSG